MEIKISGTGCKNSILLEKNLKKLLSNLNVKSNIKVVTSIDKILDYDVMMIA